MNPSTYQLVTKSLRGLNRTRLLRTKAKAYCTGHGLQEIRDLFPNREVLLACGCRRTCHNRKPEDIAAFEKEVEARKARKELVGHCQPTSGGFVRTFEENLENAA